MCLWRFGRTSGAFWRVYLTTADDIGNICKVGLKSSWAFSFSCVMIRTPSDVIEAELLCIRFLSAAPGALEKFHFSERRNGYYSTVLGLLSSLWRGGGPLAMFCILGFEEPWPELPRSEEQGNVEVSLLDFLFKNSDNTYQ